MENSDILFEVSQLGWERIFLNLKIRTNYTGTVSFRLENIRKQKPGSGSAESNHAVLIKNSGFESGEYSFSLNIAAMDGRMFLDNGCWRIVASTEAGDHICYVSHEVAYKFDDCSRVFRYGKNKYAYTVSFSTELVDEKRLIFYLDSIFMIQNNGWKKRHYVQEAASLSGKIKRIYMSFAIILIRLFYGFWDCILPKRGNRILLMSETKDYLWGNLKFIDDGLKAQKLDGKYIIDYSFRKAVGSHNSIWSWVRLIFKIAQQDYIFVDDYVPVFGFLTLGRRTKLIQVWHAGEGFKAVGYCRFGKDGSPFPSGSCHKQYDYVLTGSEKLVKVFSEVFGIEDEAFLPVGMPRLDGFLDEDRIASFRQEFYKEYPEFQGKKIILFAPTYRGTGQKTAYYDYSWLDLKEIYQFCKDEYIFMMKMHPFVSELIEIPDEYKDRIVDFSAFPNINDLYYVTDIMITDYSSNYYEFALMKRPVLFFTPDREIYELSRGVHRGVKESAPGKVCDSFEELMAALENKDYEVEKIYQFIEDNFSNYDGHATERVIEKLFLNNNDA